MNVRIQLTAKIPDNNGLGCTIAVLKSAIANELDLRTRELRELIVDNDVMTGSAYADKIKALEQSISTLLGIAVGLHTGTVSIVPDPPASEEKKGS